MTDEEKTEYFFLNGKLWVLLPEETSPKEIPPDNPLYVMLLQMENEDGKFDEYLKEDKNVKNQDESKSHCYIRRR